MSAAPPTTFRTTAPSTLPARPIDRLLSPVRRLARRDIFGAALLVLAAAVSLWLANSRWADAFEHLRHTPIALAVGPWSLDKSLLHWVNDGLMGVFFFAVGLELKREVKVGELATLRHAALPAIAAVGGMIAPAAIYYVVTSGTAASAGWGVPMATDIAFALGILALLGDRVPTGLKVYLTALAIVDDIGAVLVIALFYTDGVSLLSLGAAGVCVALAFGLNRLRVRSSVAYLLVGVAAWLAFLQSGVHATVAALLMALTIPARTRLDGAAFVETMRNQLKALEEVGPPENTSLNTSAQQRLIEEMAVTVDYADAPLSRLERALRPMVTYLVLPVFAFANAGVRLPDLNAETLRAPVIVGIGLGLVLGKPLGIMLATFGGVRSGLVALPAGVDFRHILGAGFLAGIGFTMALFIGELAFVDPALSRQAKLAVPLASLLSGVLGWAWLRSATKGTA